MMERKSNRETNAERAGETGQVAVEMAFLVPVLMLLLFGVFQLAHVFYLYHTLQKAVRGGAGLIARASNVNYCDPGDITLTDARNFIAFGNLQGVGTPIVQGLTPDVINIFPERTVSGSTTVTECLCTEDADSCDVTTGGRAPDFVVVNLGSNIQVNIVFPFVNLGSIPLKVSVRMPVTGS